MHVLWEAQSPVATAQLGQLTRQISFKRLRQFIAAGIPVVLGTDDPVQACMTIGREYAIAAALGLTTDELLTITDNAVRASFMLAARREALFATCDAQRKQQGRLKL